MGHPEDSGMGQSPERFDEFTGPCDVAPVPPTSAAARLARAMDTGSREQAAAAMIDLVGGGHMYPEHAKAADKLAADLRGVETVPLSDSPPRGTGTAARPRRATDGLSALRDVMGDDLYAAERARSALLAACLETAKLALSVANDSHLADTPCLHIGAMRLMAECQRVCAAASVLDVQIRKEIQNQ